MDPCKQTEPFWQVVQERAATVLPDRRSVREHYRKLAADLKRHLPAGVFESVAGKLKTKGARSGKTKGSPWLAHHAATLMQVVMKLAPT